MVIVREMATEDGEDTADDKEWEVKDDGGEGLRPPNIAAHLNLQFTVLYVGKRNNFARIQ